MYAILKKEKTVESFYQGEPLALKESPLQLNVVIDVRLMKDELKLDCSTRIAKVLHGIESPASLEHKQTPFWGKYKIVNFEHIVAWADKVLNI